MSWYTDQLKARGQDNYRSSVDYDREERRSSALSGPFPDYDSECERLTSGYDQEQKK